jgi:phosphoglycerol transferase MdoB-like AlkP superfamily enzyme
VDKDIEKSTTFAEVLCIFKKITMKCRLFKLIFTFLLFVLLFVVQKPLFMLCYSHLYENTTTADWLAVVYHGLALDFSIAGYLSVLPGILLVLSVWTGRRVVSFAWRIYFAIVSVLLSMIFVLNLALYSYWGFPLDTTPFFYFFTSPADAVASVSWWMVVGGIVAMLIYASFLFWLFFLVWRRDAADVKKRRRVPYSVALLLMTALLFIPIRGGFTVSTMNLGKVYFSSNQRLNHAAINPAFSLMDSFARQTDFDKQYRFLDDDEASAIFSNMVEQPSSDSIPRLFTTDRPNVVIVIMESFSSCLMESLGGEKNVAVHLDSIASEGVLFTNFYANSFRTDRGLVAVLSGYPAQPTTSIMKYTQKIQSLPSIPATMKRAGYHPYYYYGGDADFTNMRAFLTSMGMERIVSDVDFPVSQRMSKWGVHDDVVFSRLTSDLNNGEFKEPFVAVMQTSSSHEPFEVPYHRLENDRLNAFAYTDSCIGKFVDELKHSSYWNNTLLVLVPDHLGAYPEDIDNQSPARYRIPLIFTGGVVKNHMEISTIGSQIDLAATLLSQLDIASDEFVFSKNVLNSSSPHFAFFTFPNLFGLVDDEGSVVYDCETNKVVDKYSSGGERMTKWGQAFLQKLYDDIAKR